MTEKASSSNNPGHSLPRVAVVAFPWQSNAPYRFLSDVVRILTPIAEKVILITGNTDRIELEPDRTEIRDIGVSVHYVREMRPLSYSAILWIVRCFLAQILMTREMVKVRDSFQIVIFYMAYPYYLLPLIVAKILGKRTIEVVTRGRRNSLISRIIQFQDPILYALLDGISPESNSLLRELNLSRYRHKILPEGARYIDFSHYAVKVPINMRRNVVGYIGRFDRHKGIVEFIQSIPLIAQDICDVEFLIVGSGKLSPWVLDECKKIEFDWNIKSIHVLDWVPSSQIPEILNTLKLLVLPSMGEGLPTIILESMACGTPVLTTPRGAVPELIIDGETGFIMETNSPDCIKVNVTRVLRFPAIDGITTNALKFAKTHFSFQNAKNRYQQMLRNSDG